MFELHFEDVLEILPPRHILRFIRSVGDKHESIIIGKAWIESSDVKSMIEVKIIFFSYKDNVNTKYLYTDMTTYDKGCSNVRIVEIPKEEAEHESGRNL